MATTPPISTGTPAASTQLTTGDNATIDKDGFLKLFVAQLSHQDPSSPMDTSQSTEQMAMFSLVEQMTNVASQDKKIAGQLANSSAVALIGRTVTYTGADGAEHTGAVERVSTAKDGTTSLTVAGTTGVDPASITQVA